MAKFQARQFSAWIAPTSCPLATRSKRILPKTLACTISPTGVPSARVTTTRDLTSFAGRVSTSWTPVASRTSSRWVRNWSRLDTNRSAFLAALCPTSTTAPICWACPSYTAYSLVSSISFVRWLTTRTDCSYSETLGWAATACGIGACCGGDCCGVGGGGVCCWTGGGGGGGVGAAWTCSVQPCPSHQRVPPLPAGSGYQPGGGGCVTAVKLVGRARVRTRLAVRRVPDSPPWRT